MAEIENKTAFDWDDEIFDDGTSNRFIVLPEGDYTFKVAKMERGRFKGSAKIDACPKAALTLTVATPEGTASFKCDLLLSHALEWKLSSFFRCIGQKKQGEKLAMNWGKVEGAEGKAHISVHEWPGDDGKTHKSNQVDHFIDPEEKKPSLTTKTVKPETDNTGDTPDDELPF